MSRINKHLEGHKESSYRWGYAKKRKNRPKGYRLPKKVKK